MNAENTNLLKAAQNNMLQYTTPPQKVMQQGNGCYLYSHSGEKYLDFVSGWGCNILGHCHPKIVAALNKQSKTLINAGPGILNTTAIAFAKKLCSASKMQRVFFCNTGAEANENAIKLARKYGKLKKNGAYQILTLNKSFHGRTLATMAATAKPGWNKMFPPAVKGFTHLRAPLLSELEKKTTPKTVALMIELIQGEGGVHPLSKEFVKNAALHCKKNNMLLIIDEVQTGMGRTGHILASHSYNIKPHIVTLGKAIGGGFPLAAMLAQEELNIFQPGETGGTYGGQPLAASCGLAVLEMLQNKTLMKSSAKSSATLFSKLKILSKQSTNKQTLPHISNVRGKGMMIGFDVANGKANQLMEASFNNGLLITAPQPSSIRLLPPLITTSTEINLFFEKLLQSYKSLSL